MYIVLSAFSDIDSLGSNPLVCNVPDFFSVLFIILSLGNITLILSRDGLNILLVSMESSVSALVRSCLILIFTSSLEPLYALRTNLNEILSDMIALCLCSLIRTYNLITFKAVRKIFYNLRRGPPPTSEDKQLYYYISLLSHIMIVWIV